MLRRVISRVSSTRSRNFHCSATKLSDFSHVVIGGGICGVAIASELQEINGNNVLLLEKHGSLGTETTSRNSEVIHAGLYYPEDSLKSKLCVKGKEKIYEAFLRKKTSSIEVALKNCGKWIMAQDSDEEEYLEKVRLNANRIGVPSYFVSSKKVQRQFPLIRGKLILESPTTGIISAHDLVLFFQANFENNEGTLGLNTELFDLEFNSTIPNYRLSLREKESNEAFEITTDNVINSGGLYAPRIANLLLPKERHYNSYFAKGTYFSYQPSIPIKSNQITNKLLYPCPNPNASSLGTHLTFDLGGQIKFGPDIEWLDISDADQIDYTASFKNIEDAYKAISRYIPSLEEGELEPSYVGVRPKLSNREESKQRFQDFHIKEEKGYPGFVNLIGIESPGLTAAWAIAAHVKDMFHK